ncbi:MULTISPECIES: XRE family transcriptional regulator [unclassified Gilliamella]|uniref:XRE family transcriptional regulator n=1 Tax=unclassified Gilliamella TaxID=2685620 RepID=UPI00226A2509|nr:MULTISPECIES: helix-turn-helix transcriptional regulator [unclassified Gilliamella]MCX8574139.1 helix-turn-helix transcriptional regulator [Gilliamella sp. B3831]MCX8576370.1 helix-turn-helix transcriptional regulator [Gilliamella sp. B3815]MCX8578428.1 helix-turn-helix transcriptional regulator [Gilliamella sp. B2717]MCX8603471.1 helix-turn-helix transcriptional regulator [Gilliamella sp. B3823]MCX8606912.1 helix-turn-helix transcriptional regulator [Gilliamella sp. B3825]
MTTFTERLNSALKQSGMSQHQLAEKVKISQPAIQKLLSGKSNTSRKIVEIANALNVDLLWLTKGVGKSKLTKNSANATMLGAIDEWDSKTPLDEDEVEVPFYKDVRLSAGNGFADDIEDYNGYKLRLSRSTMRKYGIDKDCAVCLTVYGDSMEPVFRDGSTVGINQADTNIRDGKIYAINHDGLLRIKILERLPGNQVKIRSYNSDYDDETVSLDDITILGRVWWQSSILD